MILLSNEVWQDVVATVPFRRRTLLLPPCLRSSTRCPAQFDEFGLLCERCGNCVLGALSSEAEELGYAVLIAEGTTIVASLIEQGLIDAVIGVSCMGSLERAFEPMSTHALPGLAIPLVRDGCRDTDADTEWIRRAIRLSANGGAVQTVDLKALHEDVRTWFEEDALRARLGIGSTETERIGLSWLAKAGKRWRPVLAVGVYRALCPDGEGGLPDSIRSVALAVECIHKASLIYDDIQDGDDCRYGDDTVHRTHGVPVALTASLLLLGHGYRLLSDCGASAAQKTEMLRLATEGHCELCLGQGAELCWMRDPRPLSCAEVLDIFRQKTAPSFEVVFRLGAVCADAPPDVHEVLKAYSRFVGVGYQVQDDLQDFREGGDVDDVRSRRPSIMLALAYEGADPAQKERIAAAWCGGRGGAGADEIRAIIAANKVEEKAKRVLARYRDEALRSLRPLKHRDLKILLHRMAGKVLGG
jgi:geranylgeranyl pyrophosphate synthase